MLDTPTDPSRNIKTSSFAHKYTTMTSIVRCKTFSIITKIFFIKLFIVAIALINLSSKYINYEIDNKNAHNAHNITIGVYITQNLFLRSKLMQYKSPANGVCTSGVRSKIRVLKAPMEQMRVKYFT